MSLDKLRLLQREEINQVAYVMVVGSFRRKRAMFAPFPFAELIINDGKVGMAPFYLEKKMNITRFCFIVYRPWTCSLIFVKCALRFVIKGEIVEDP